MLMGGGAAASGALAQQQGRNKLHIPHASDSSGDSDNTVGATWGHPQPMQEDEPGLQEACSSDLDERIKTSRTASSSGLGNKEAQVGDVILVYSAASRMGMDRNSRSGKKTNQDALNVTENLGGAGHMLFGVFDGHGEQGAEVAQALCDRLPGALMSCQTFQTCRFHRAFTAAFAECNDYLTTSGEIDCFMSGSTAISGLLLKDGRLLIANVGDSQCILGRLDAEGKSFPISLNREHRPDCHEEAQRIFKSDGRILKRNMSCPGRVYLPKYDVPGLAMTRAFGDTLATRVGVIADPDLSLVTLTSSDKYLIFCSDGITTYIANEDIVALVHNRAQLGWSPQEVANELVSRARAEWERQGPPGYIDDCTAIVVFLNAPRPLPQPEPRDHGVLRSWVKRRRPARPHGSDVRSSVDDRRSLDRRSFDEARCTSSDKEASQ